MGISGFIAAVVHGAHPPKACLSEQVHAFFVIQTALIH
jgi:hypothetical protein